MTVCTFSNIKLISTSIEILKLDTLDGLESPMPGPAGLTSERSSAPSMPPPPASAHGSPAPASAHCSPAAASAHGSP